MNTFKPLSPSKISAWAIKYATALAEPLFYPIIQFITEGKFPEEHRKACLTPRFKKGNTENPLTYRPVYVTSAMSNFLERRFVHRSQIS